MGAPDQAFTNIISHRNNVTSSKRVKRRVRILLAMTDQEVVLQKLANKPYLSIKAFFDFGVQVINPASIKENANRG